MTIKQAKQDAQSRANRTGLYWWVIQLSDKTYEAVQSEHLVTHKDKYKAGIFKVIGDRYSTQIV